MDAAREFILQWLDPIGIVLSLVLSIPILWTWWNVTFGESRRRKIWYRQARQQKGLRPAILIIDLLTDKDVRAQVEHFRAQDETLKTIPDDRIFALSRDKWFTPEEVHDFQKDLRNTSAQIMRAGVDMLYLFYAGPTISATMVGAEFANAGCKVLVYHNERGSYVNFGPLRSPV